MAPAATRAARLARARALQDVADIPGAGLLITARSA